MPLKKRKPGLIILKSKKRLKGMKYVDTNHKHILNYGSTDSPVTSTIVEELVNRCIELNNEYNLALSMADDRSANLKEAERQLTDLYSRILPGCISIFGNDAKELALLGGTRKSERKRPKKRKK